MSNYKYVSPTEKGYTQFKLTRKKHNELFPYYQIKWFNKCDYYYNQYGIYIERFTNIYGVVLSVLAFPLSLLLNGLASYKEIYIELTGLLNQKERGRFVSDYMHHDAPKYKEVLKIINNDGV